MIDLFLHIPKTAGTSLATALGAGLPEAAVWRSYSPTATDEFCRHFGSGGRTTSYRLGTAHLPYTAVNRCPLGTTRTFTVLRHPVERALSHLQFALSRERDHWVKSITSAPASPAVLELPELRRLFTNFQTRLLGADIPVSATGPHVESWAARSTCPNQLTLWRAKARLRAMPWIGVTERLEQDLLELAALIGRPLQLDRENVRPPHERLCDEDQDLRRVLGEINVLDLELYEFALALVDAQRGGED